MVGKGTKTTMRFVRSKLRKREETSPNHSPVVDPHQRENDVNYIHSEPSHPTSPEIKSLKQISEAVNCTDCSGGGHIFSRTSGMGSKSDWTFPPTAPVPNIYGIKQDMSANTCDGNGFKGFRKQFSGRFKRFVARKPEPSSVIPPELKPQLKTIYVY